MSARREWTTGELSALREHYPAHGPSWPGWADVLPGRTWNAVNIMASHVGLTRRAPRWTPAQDESLGRILAELARRTGRTPGAVAARMKHLAVSATGEEGR